MLRQTWNIIKTTIWLLCQFSGLRLIFRKLIPSTEKAKNKPNYRKPSSFIFWALGTVYLAMFNYVAQQYKDKVDALESRANLIIAQLSNKQNKENDNDIKLYEVNGIRENALAQIAGIQNTLIPFKPKLLSPQSVYKSLYVKEKNSAVINDFKKIIIAIQAGLVRAKLQNIDLSECKFLGANMEEASLANANLKDTYFHDVNFISTDFSRAQFGDKAMFYLCKLNNACFNDTSLSGVFFASCRFRAVELNNADFNNASFNDISLCGINLENVKNIAKADFKNVFYLYISKKDREFIKENINNREKQKKTDLNEDVLNKFVYFSKTENTKFPKGFEPEKANMLNEWKLFKESFI